MKIYNSHCDYKLKNCNYSMLFITISISHILKLYLTITILNNVLVKQSGNSLVTV